MWAMVLGTLSLAALVTMAVGWTGAKDVAAGFKIGATVGFLAWFGVDMILYGALNFSDLTGAVVDSILELVRTGLGGAVIAVVLGKGTDV